MSALAREAELCVSSAASAISTNIAIERSGIHNAFINLQNKANAVPAGPNVQLCKNKLNIDLSLVNDQSINVCYNNAAMNLLKQRVTQINNLKGAAKLICRKCLEESTCVETDIGNLREQAQNLKQGVCSDASAEQEKSAKCAKGAVDGQLEIIQTASDNFDACIQGA